MKSKIKPIILFSLVVAVSICPSQSSWGESAHAPMHLRNAKEFSKKGEELRAVSELMRARESDPKLIEAYLELGNIYLRQREYERARDEFEKALTIDPKCTDAYLQLGMIYRNEKKFYRAIDEYRKAIAVCPDIPAAYLGLGNIYDLLDEHEEAEKAYAMYRKLMKY